MLDAIAGVVGDDDEDGEAEHRHEQIGDEIEGDRGARERDDADEEIAGVRDAGVGEEAFEIGLRERGEVAVDEREDGKDDEQSLYLWENEKRLEHAQKNDEARGFRADGEERGDRRGRALIDIRAPRFETGRRRF